MKHLFLVLIFSSLFYQTAGIEFTRQDQNKVKQIITRKLVKGSWKDVRKEEFSYDEHGHLETHTNLRYSDGKWVKVSRLAYEYDPKTQLEIERTWQNWKAGDWAMVLRFSPQRDEQDHLIEEKVDRFENGTWVLSRKNNSKYNALSNLKSEQAYYNLKDSEWSASWKDKYEYDDEKLVIKRGFQWTETGWSSGMITEYTYDSKNNRIAEKMIRVTGDNKTNWRKTTYSYEDGLKRSSTTEIFKDGTWQVDETSEITY